MNKLLLSAFLLLSINTIRSMEEGDTEPGIFAVGDENTKDEQENRGTPGLFRQLLGELQERILDFTSHASAQKIINEIEAIVKNNEIKRERYEHRRHFRNPLFIEIGGIIENAPSCSYSGIALYVALSKNFSKFEKNHFLSIMIMHENITVDQRIILEFLAEQIEHFRADVTYQSGVNMSATTSADFMKSSFSISDPEEMKIVIDFLLKNGIKLPKSTLGYFINTGNIDLVRWALRKGIVLNETMCLEGIPLLEYCRGRLGCWLDENWTQGGTSEEQLNKNGHKIGKTIYSALRDKPSEETINEQIEHFQTLINLLEAYMPKNSEENTSKT